ncbi:MAG: iron-containing alcohol dehydrogenase [Planctomycetes bacterium]|nr:iron-containing alcohol dehydrogenase [Planctomycetota bacterium]
MPRSFQYSPRTQIIFGNGSIEQLGELAAREGVAKVLLVTDPGIAKAGHAGRAMDFLKRAGLTGVLFDGVEENPTSKHVDAGVEVAQRESIELIVGLGGGSAMDCAKGINFLFSCGGEMKDYWGIGKATRDLLPMIAVPTTAGTGSETQSFALISDPVTHQKMACGDPSAACRVALLDPELTVSQPGHVTAATGTDAMVHAVETFVTRPRNSISTMFAREAWSLLSESYERVLTRPGDIEARGKMLLGASLAGLAIENSMLGATHSAANPLTAEFGVVHGAAVGMLLPHVVRFNASVVGEEYQELARLIALPVDGRPDSGEPLASYLEESFSKSGLPRTLKECGVTEDFIPGLAEGATEQWTAQFNPREVTKDDFEKLYRSVLS